MKNFQGEGDCFPINEVEAMAKSSDALPEEHKHKKEMINSVMPT